MTCRLAALLVPCLFSLFLVGCASPPQQPIALTENVFSTSQNKVGVLMTELPKVDTSFPGAGCLLCYAAASVANSNLTAHTITLPTDEIVGLKALAAKALKKRGMEPVVISDLIVLDKLPNSSTAGVNISRKDFSSIKSKYGVDKLLVINITNIGFLRTYSAYFPTSEPKASVYGTVYLVNLNTNTYEWYLPLDILRSADGGTWDEPPKFPGLSNAYFQALEIAKDAVMTPLGK